VLSPVLSKAEWLLTRSIEKIGFHVYREVTGLRAHLNARVPRGQQDLRRSGLQRNPPEARADRVACRGGALHGDAFEEPGGLQCYGSRMEKKGPWFWPQLTCDPGGCENEQEKYCRKKK